MQGHDKTNEKQPAGSSRAGRLPPVCLKVTVFTCALIFTARAEDVAAPPAMHIPMTRATAIDGHSVELPRDLPGRITVMILGFGRKSADPTTAWEKPTRSTLAHLPDIGFLDLPIIAEVPGFIRPMVLRSVRKQVPDVLKPNFIPLTTDESTWKHVAGYQEGEPDAAYVLLVDRSGLVRWSTHGAYTPDRFASMAAEVRSLLAEAR